MDDERTARLLSRLERAAVCLLLLAALVPRARDLGGTWDRELEGFQGSCFAAFAVNSARLGPLRFGGYPVFNVDLPGDPDVLPYVYPNHPPLVPLLAWATLSLTGPAGWSTAWKSGEPPPRGTERALRTPFLLGHLALLVALWWCVRRVGGARLALLSLAVAATLPLLILYGALVNYENLVWPPLLVGVGLHQGFLVDGRRRTLHLAGLAFLLAGCVTFTPAFLVPPLVLQTLLRRGWRDTLRTGTVLSLGALVPAAAHGLWVRHWLPPEMAGSVVVRVREMLTPLFDGGHPFGEWLRRQLVRAAYFFTWPVLVLAAAGLLVVLVRAVRARRSGGPAARPSPGPALLAGGLLLLFAFYRHTWDGDGARNGQTVFLIDLAPGLAVLVAEALDALARPLRRLRGGEAPLIALCALVLLPCVVHANAIRRAWREPGPLDVPPGALGPAAPLPYTAGRELAAILPPRSVGIYPAELGYTAAVSYYAWRTLVPATPATYDHALQVVEDVFGLGDLPRYVVLPKEPPPEAAAAVERVRAIVREHCTLQAETARWERWTALPPSPPAGTTAPPPPRKG